MDNDTKESNTAAPVMQLQYQYTGQRHLPTVVMAMCAGLLGVL